VGEGGCYSENDLGDGRKLMMMSFPSLPNAERLVSVV